MAKVLLGAGIVEVTGKIGGTVFQRGKAGTIMRKKVSPRKGARNIFYKSAGLTYNSHQRAQQSFIYLNRQWKELTQKQRDSWNEKATGKDTGINLFIHRNMRAGGLTVSFPSYEPVPVQYSIIKDAVTYWYPEALAYIIGVTIHVGAASQRNVRVYIGKPHSIGRAKSDTFTFAQEISPITVPYFTFLFPTGFDPGYSGAIDARVAIADSSSFYVFDSIPALFKGNYPSA